MKADFNYDEFPGRFAHCLNEKCVRRDTCLRHQVKSVLSSCSTNRSGSPEA